MHVRHGEQILKLEVNIGRRLKCILRNTGHLCAPVLETIKVAQAEFSSGL